MQAGRAAGCRTLLLTKLKIEQIERYLNMQGAEPDAIAETLSDAFSVMQSCAKSKE